MLPAVVVREKLLTAATLKITQEIPVAGGYTQADAIYRQGHRVLEERDLLYDLPPVHSHHVDPDHLPAAGGSHHPHALSLAREKRVAHLEQRHMLDLLQSWNGLQGEHVEDGDASIPQDQQMVEKRDCPQLGHLVAQAQFSCPTFSGSETRISICAAGKDEMLDCCIFGAYVDVSLIALNALDAGFVLFLRGCLLFIDMSLCKCSKSHRRNGSNTLRVCLNVKSSRKYVK